MNALTPIALIADLPCPAVAAPHPDTPVLRRAPSGAHLLRAMALSLAELVRRDGTLPGLTQRQLAVLLHLVTTEGPHTLRGTAAALHLSKPAICRAFDVLRAAGLLVRQPDPRDGRSIVVHLTRPSQGVVRDLQHALLAAHRGAEA